VILEDDKEVEAVKTSSKFMKATKNKTIHVLDDFYRDYFKIVNTLNDLTKDNFVVLTTKEGGRGIDMKGNSKSHVIIAFECKLYSQVVQALGRGSRSLDSYSEGTVIQNDPVHPNTHKFLDSLSMIEHEYAEAMGLSSKICRLLHM